MMQEVRDALEGCDLVLLITDVTQKFGTGEQFTLDLAKQAKTPVILLLNKIDLVDKRKLLPLIEQWSKLHEFREIIPISARKKHGLDDLLDAIVRTLPEAQAYFPADQITDQPLRFLAAEIVREQVLIHTKQEIPYATTVLIDSFEEGERLVRIAATIYCEREGQKAILIGKGGAMLKKIGTQGRKELEPLLGTKVFLELFVKVRDGWRDSRSFVEELDWRKQLEALSHKEEP
jgi:GTP-binding protein Era